MMMKILGHLHSTPTHSSVCIEGLRTPISMEGRRNLIFVISASYFPRTIHETLVDIRLEHPIYKILLITSHPSLEDVWCPFDPYTWNFVLGERCAGSRFLKHLKDSGYNVTTTVPLMEDANIVAE